MEQSARELTEAIAKGPALSDVSLADARKAVETAQSAPIPMPDIDQSWVTLSSPFGDFEVRIVRPPGSAGPLPVILYVHGGGWILGSSITHDLLTRRLAVGVNAAVAFVEYARAPEAKYPTQIEQCYAAARWIVGQGAGGGFDPARIAVAGDSAGGNMATVLALMAKQRGDVRFVHQSLYYPMTDAGAEDSESLRKFKDGPYGSATTPDGVVIFDAPPSIGHNIRRAIDETTAANGLTNQVTHQVYSHHHCDHQGASSLFGGHRPHRPRRDPAAAAARQRPRPPRPGRHLR